MHAGLGTYVTAISLLAALTIPARVAARAPHGESPRYILVDLGTLGGPNSSTPDFASTINNSGVAMGAADTPRPNPNYPNANPQPAHMDSFVEHAFLWRKGLLTDLGALPGDNNNSYPYGVNARGDVAGFSENGVTDPLLRYPEGNAVLWRDGHLIDLGTLPGGTESLASAVNNWDQVVGFASNTIPDPYSIVGWATQTRAVLWQGGTMRELGTLGGPDSLGATINGRGQIAGWSYTNTTPNPVTQQPTVDPFLWQNGHMQDLGTLGGTSGIVNRLTDSGMVVGQSNLAGDHAFHPFMWSGGTLKDLGTLGGDGTANWANDFGQVVGWADTPGDTTMHAVLWRDGVMRDLGVSPGDDYSFATSINLAGQVVGGAGAFGKVGHGMLWEHGASFDLNTLVMPTALHVTGAASINARGEIAGSSVLPNGNRHAVLLIPTDEADRDGFAQNAPPPSSVVPAALSLDNTTACPTLAAWLAELTTASVRARLGRDTLPACLGA